MAKRKRRFVVGYVPRRYEKGLCLLSKEPEIFTEAVKRLNLLRNPNTSWREFITNSHKAKIYELVEVKK